jgi:hypothetical protein
LTGQGRIFDFKEEVISTAGTTYEATEGRILGSSGVLQISDLGLRVNKL